jgi:hypothetical protein
MNIGLRAIAWLDWVIRDGEDRKGIGLDRSNIERIVPRASLPPNAPPGRSVRAAIHPLLTHALEGTIPYEPLRLQGEHHRPGDSLKQVTIRPYDGP